MVDNNEHTAAYKSTVHPDFLKTMANPYARMALHSAGMTKQLLARVMDESLPVMGAGFFASLSGKPDRTTGCLRMYERAGDIAVSASACSLMEKGRVGC